jgi:hypothetical protein
MKPSRCRNPLVCYLLLAGLIASTAWFLACKIIGFEILLTDRVPLEPHRHDNARVVIGISTFGQRIFHMGPTLQSVLAQSRTPDRIIVSIPKVYRQTRHQHTACGVWIHDCATDPVQYDESQAGILAWFANQTATTNPVQIAPNIFEFHRSLTLVFLDTDWGAGTKALGALTLEHDPQTILITLDDDTVYYNSTVEWLATHIGPDMALGLACQTWDPFHEFFIDYPLDSSIAMRLSLAPRMCNGWLFGWQAVAYRVRHFGPDIWTFLDTLPRGCFFNDDIWLSGYLARKGIPRVFAPAVLPHPHHRRDKALSLSTIDNTREKYGYPCARALFG